MAYTDQVDLLEPIDLSEHLDKVELYLGQVCQIAGISKMQLDYWTNKAQIPTKGKKQRIYDIDALETVMLIKQAQGQGPEPRRGDRRRPRFRQKRRRRWTRLRGTRCRARRSGFRTRPLGTEARDDGRSGSPRRCSVRVRR